MKENEPDKKNENIQALSSHTSRMFFHSVSIIKFIQIEIEDEDHSNKP